MRGYFKTVVFSRTEAYWSQYTLKTSFCFVEQLMSDSLKVGTITTYLSLVSNEELLPRDIYKNMKTRTQSVSL